MSKINIYIYVYILNNGDRWGQVRMGGDGTGGVGENLIPALNPSRSLGTKFIAIPISVSNQIGSNGYIWVEASGYPVIATHCHPYLQQAMEGFY